MSVPIAAAVAWVTHPKQQWDTHHPHLPAVPHPHLPRRHPVDLTHMRRKSLWQKISGR